MRGPVAIALVLGGCRGLLGIDDAIVGDAGITPDTPDATLVDASTCHGAGLVRVCLELPAGARSLTGTISTDTGCDLVTAADQCVIAGASLRVPSTNVRFTGSRPLVLVASTISVEGTLDASSRRLGGSGPGANQGCPATGARAGANDSGGGAGGGGGSFRGRGGMGGTGDLDSSGAPAGTAAGGTPGAPDAVAFHGGCEGGRGGEGIGTSGAGGAGGGGVYLIADTKIEISGAVTANGAGGTGGAVTRGGGGGGGSGGFIGLDAPTITIAGIVTANGGGGGEGANNQPGGNGVDGSASTNRAAGGAQFADAGDGGAGSAGGALDGTAAGSADAGAGGGGGGAGYLYAVGALTITGVASPTFVP